MWIENAQMSSRASRTGAMIDARIASVDANRSRVLLSSSYAFARFIPPMHFSIGE